MPTKGGYDTVNLERNGILKSVSISEIELRMNVLRTEEQTPAVTRALQRLGFVHLRYRGFTVSEAADIIGVSVQTGYNWQDAWNAEGVQSVFPEFGGGRSSRLTEEQRAELRSAVAEKAMTTEEARVHIEAEYGVGYSEKQVHVILESLGLQHVSRIKHGIRTGAGAPEHGRMVWTERRFRM